MAIGRGSITLQLLLALTILLLCNTSTLADDPNPQMLLFGDHVAMAKAGLNFPTVALTFEAWMLSHDSCHQATPFSYSAKNSPGGNGFVIFNSGSDLTVCINEMYIIPTCSGWQTEGGPIALADGRWHHLVVTWTAANRGAVHIYVDGLLRKNFTTGHTEPLPQDGMMVLGNEQDCMGGCFDTNQGYFGAMDEIRLWRVERTQEEILDLLHSSGDRVLKAAGADQNLVGYWMLSEKGGNTAFDSSATGHNDFQLTFPPVYHPAKVDSTPVQHMPKADHLLSFSNNFARNEHVHGFPSGSFTLEFWARDTKNLSDGYTTSGRSTFFSYGAEGKDKVADLAENSEALFVPQAIAIYKEMATSTINVVINGVPQGATGAVIADSAWHHIGLAWDQKDGTTKVYIDGEELWAGKLEAGTSRSPQGCLVLGQNQHCCGGCFEVEEALYGAIAKLRVWSRALTNQEVKDLYSGAETVDRSALSLEYDMAQQHKEQERVQNSLGHMNDLILGSSAPLWQASTAPIEGEYQNLHLDKMGYAMELSEGVSLFRTAVTTIPENEFTIEVWMRSIHVCSAGTLLSYKFGPDAKDAVSLTRDRQAGLMLSLHGESRGTGFKASDGTWHHLAVTWQSSSGAAVLYSNGVEVYRGALAKGITILPGGSLSLGASLNCIGGCVDPSTQFYGQLDEVRIWNTALSARDLRHRWRAFDLKVEEGLSAYWKFDEGDGFETRDSSGNGLHLVLTQPQAWVVSTAGEYVKWGGVPPPQGAKKRAAHPLAGAFGLALGLALVGMGIAAAYSKREALMPMALAARTWTADRVGDTYLRLRGSPYRRPSILEALDEEEFDDYQEAPAESKPLKASELKAKASRV